jgi:hypothetical protein
VTRAPIGLEHLASLHRQHWHESLIHPQAVSDDIEHLPVAIMQLQHRNVGLPIDR